MAIKENLPGDQAANNEIGFCVAGQSIKTLSIKKQFDGTASIVTSQNCHEILFNLNPEQVEHIVKLLLSVCVQSFCKEE